MDLSRREEACPGGRELDRQRAVIELCQQRRQERIVGVHPPAAARRAVAEQIPRVARRQRLQGHLERAVEQDRAPAGQITP